MEATSSRKLEATMLRQCILHVGGKPLEKKGRLEVKSFTDKSWAAILTAANNRKRKPNFRESKYHGIVQNLPEQPSETDGFHLLCYQKCTAVTAESCDAQVNIQIVPHLRSADTSRNKESPSTTGILPFECLFCGLQKKIRRIP